MQQMFSMSDELCGTIHAILQTVTRMLLSSRIQEQMADQEELERCDHACEKTFHQSACLLKLGLCISYHAGTKTSIVKNIDVIAKVAYTHKHGGGNK